MQSYTLMNIYANFNEHFSVKLCKLNWSFYDNYMNINRIKELIEASKIGKSRLSELTKVSRTTIENLLAGADVKVSTIENLAYVLKVPVGYFFDDGVINVSASGMQAIATASGAVSVGTKNNVDGDSIGTQYNYAGYDNETRKDTIMTLTETVATLTKELDTSQQQKSHLIDVVATSQQQIQQLTAMVDRLTK